MRERLLEVIGKLEESGWRWDCELLQALFNVVKTASPNEIEKLFEAFK